MHTVLTDIAVVGGLLLAMIWGMAVFVMSLPHERPDEKIPVRARRTRRRHIYRVAFGLSVAALAVVTMTATFLTR